MALRLRIDHRTRYLYDQPVSFSPHFVRLFPRTEPGRLVQKITFETSPGADVQLRRDIFDNHFARCFYPDKFADLFFNLAVDIELHEQNPFHFLLDPEAVDYPFHYQPETASRLAACLRPPPDESPQTSPAKLLPLPFWQVPAGSVPTVSLLLDLMAAVRANIRYEQRVEGAAHPPADTLRFGHGSCRDFAVLFAAILRELGFAARLASGYLCEFDQLAKDRKSDGYMHMWTEVFLPGAGWTGLDATNGVFCNHNFITTAVGLLSAEITPISGRYYSNVAVHASMSAHLALTALGSTD
jgi:transglutaminase-like putative cysteine protease